MGLGPRGDGRAGPRRRAGPMTTAILFGFLLVGGWRLGPPSASAGPPRLRRRPEDLRGDVCGDARARAADAVSDFCCTGSQSRWASSLPLGHCVMVRPVPRPTKKPHDMAPGDDKKVGAYVDEILKTDFAGLQGDDWKKCADEGLVQAVKTKMGWDKPPAKRWLAEVYRSHLARKEEETLNAQHETHNNSRDASSSESSESDDDDDDKSAGFVGLDDDDDDGAPASVSVAPPTARPRRGVKPSEDQLRAERMVPVRAALRTADLALQKAVRDKGATQRALGALGISGDGVSQTGPRFPFDDKAYAIKQAERALPDEHGLDFSRMTTAREVWLALIQYSDGLADGALEKRIEETRARCDQLTTERRACAPKTDVRVATKASAAAGLERKIKNEAEDEAADSDLIACGVFSPDGRGAKLGGSTPFGRVVAPRAVPKLPHYVARPDQEGPVWGQDEKSERPIIVRSGRLLAKVCLGSGAYYDVGIGDSNQSQVPIASIHRNAADVAAVAIDGAWCGLRVDGCDQKLSHRGRLGLATILLDVYEPADVWAIGGSYDWTEAMPHMGMAVGSSEPVQTLEFGKLEEFRRVCFVGVDCCIPGGLEALDGDRLRFASMMCAAVKAHDLSGNTGSVRLGPCTLRKMNPSKPAVESNYRVHFCEPQRQAGEINAATVATLTWLKSERFHALHFVAERAARLGHVKLRLLSYAHPGSGRFHFDGAGDKPKTSKRMATALAAADAANLDSLNFSLASGPKKARMGPI